MVFCYGFPLPSSSVTLWKRSLDRRPGQKATVLGVHWNGGALAELRGMDGALEPEPGHSRIIQYRGGRKPKSR